MPATKKKVKKKAVAKKKVKKKAQERNDRQPPKPDEFNYIYFALRRYLDDLSSIRDLAMVVPPLLLTKSRSVSTRIGKLLGEPKDGKYTLSSDKSRKRILELAREQLYAVSTYGTDILFS